MLEQSQLRVSLIQNKVYIDRWPGIIKGISDNAAEQVHQKVLSAPMSGMHKLPYVLQYVIDSFNNGSFTKHQLVIEVDQLILHIALQIGYQLNSIIEQILKQFLRDVSFVGIKLPKQFLRQIVKDVFIPIVHIGWG